MILDISDNIISFSFSAQINIVLRYIPIPSFFFLKMLAHYVREESDAEEKFPRAVNQSFNL